MFIIHVIDSFLLCHIDIFSKALLMLRITKYRIVKFPFKSFSGGINVKKKCQGDIFSSHTGPSGKSNTSKSPYHHDAYIYHCTMGTLRRFKFNLDFFDDCRIDEFSAEPEVK